MLKVLIKVNSSSVAPSGNLKSDPEYIPDYVGIIMLWIDY